MITPEDLRVAVDRGLISSAQADALMMIADTRADAGAAAREEPLLLYRGFNEIFIVVGLVILFGGWLALIFEQVAQSAFSPSVVIAAQGLTLLGVIGCQYYFTRLRRMMAPSILLAGLTALLLALIGQTIGARLPLSLSQGAYLAAGLMGAGMVLHYRVFRLPFDMVLIALAVLRALQLSFAPASFNPIEILLPVGALPLVVSTLFGLAAFVAAMAFDLSDPERRTSRAASGFWLHVVAAMALVGPVAQGLIAGGREDQILLLAFLGLLALIALVIDRRSFLVSGAAYAAWLIFDMTGGSLMTVFILGLLLVLLGAQWDRLRALLLRALPAFPGKSRLPPYGLPRKGPTNGM